MCVPARRAGHRILAVLAAVPVGPVSHLDGSDVTGVSGEGPRTRAVIGERRGTLLPSRTRLRIPSVFHRVRRGG